MATGLQVLIRVKLTHACLVTDDVPRLREFEPYAPGATAPGTNRGIMREFEVADVHADHACLNR